MCHRGIIDQNESNIAAKQFCLAEIDDEKQETGRKYLLQLADMRAPRPLIGIDEVAIDLDPEVIPPAKSLLRHEIAFELFEDGSMVRAWCFSDDYDEALENLHAA